MRSDLRLYICASKAHTFSMTEALAATPASADAAGAPPRRAWIALGVLAAGLGMIVLDGGLAAWRAAGLAVASGDETTEPGTATLHPGQLPQRPSAEAPAVAAGAGGVLVDARAGER